MERRRELLQALIVHDDFQDLPAAIRARITTLASARPENESAFLKEVRETLEDSRVAPLVADIEAAPTDNRAGEVVNPADRTEWLPADVVWICACGHREPGDEWEPYSGRYCTSCNGATFTR